jgi:hypothetical protein
MVVVGMGGLFGSWAGLSGLFWLGSSGSCLHLRLRWGERGGCVLAAVVLLSSCIVSGPWVAMSGVVGLGMGVVWGWVGGGFLGRWNCPAVSLGVWILRMEVGVNLSLMTLS